MAAANVRESVGSSLEEIKKKTGKKEGKKGGEGK